MGTAGRTAIFLAGLALAACSAPIRPRRTEESLLTVRVREFEFHGTSGSRGHRVTNFPGDLAEAAADLAIHAHVRICIEGQSVRSGRPVEITAKNATVKEILDRLIGQDDSYEYRERLGVIEVFPRGALEDPDDCLNMVIPAFNVHYPWRMAWGQVACEMRIIAHDPSDVVPDPLAAGRCWGASHLVAPPPQVLEATFRRKPLHEILDQLSSMAGNAGWGLYARISRPNCQRLGNEVGEGSPTIMYRIEGTSPPRYTEKMPTECTRCHYHQEVPAH